MTNNTVPAAICFIMMYLRVLHKQNDLVVFLSIFFLAFSVLAALIRYLIALRRPSFLTAWLISCLSIVSGFVPFVVFSPCLSVCLSVCLVSCPDQSVFLLLVSSVLRVCVRRPSLMDRRYSYKYQECVCVKSLKLSNAFLYFFRLVLPQDTRLLFLLRRSSSVLWWLSICSGGGDDSLLKLSLSLSFSLSLFLFFSWNLE